MSPGISVIICCYNSAERLPETIRHLAFQQTSAPIAWEIIVVDNASGDATATVAETELLKYQYAPFSYRILQEPRKGKSFALDTGVQQAQYSYILICDDDNWLHPNYLTIAYNLMEANDTIGAASGQSTVVSDSPVPTWFNDYQYAYAVGKQYGATGFIKPNERLWGAGMIFRKKAYLQTYAIAPSLLSGPNTETLSRGEDVEFCMRLSLLGYKLFYSEDLQFQHFMPAGRLTPNYKNALLKGYEYEQRILTLYTRLINIKTQATVKNFNLLISSLFKLVIGKLFTKGKWSYKYEAEMLYLLTGVQLNTIAEEAMLVKSIAKHSNKPAVV